MAIDFAGHALPVIAGAALALTLAACSVARLLLSVAVACVVSAVMTPAFMAASCGLPFDSGRIKSDYDRRTAKAE